MTVTASAQIENAGLGHIPAEFLSAKLRGRRSRLYEGERLVALASLSSVAELGASLFPHDEEIRGAFELEQRLTAACVQELAFFLRYLSGAQEALYRALLDRYPLENIKTLLRLLGRQDAGARAERLLITLPPELSMPVEDLVRATSVEEFVRRIPLKNARSRAIAALPLYERAQQTAFLEMALDRGYWEAVWQAMGSLWPGDRKACSAPITCEYDALRLVAVLRAARTYGLDWEILEQALPLAHGRLSKARLRRFHEKSDPDELRRSLPALRRAPVALEAEEEDESVSHIEDILWRETLRAAVQAFHSAAPGSGSLGALTGYYYLKRHELRQLTMIAQMIRTGRGQREVVQALEVLL